MNKDADINNEQLLEELAKLRKKNKELEDQLKAANKQIDAKVSQKTKDLRKSQNDYQMLFNESPVPTWEEDFSQCKTYIDSLKKRNIINFREYFENNPDEVIEASKKIKIININKAAVKLHEAKSKQEILHSLSSIFTDKSYETVTEQLICIAEGKKAYESEGIVKTIAGLEKNILLKWVVGSGYEDTLEKVFLTITDITELKRAKDKLKEANQELEANNQQLQATEQQLRATNQQLETNYQQLIATEKALRNSEDRLSKTLMAANDGMWDWDLKTNNVFFDARYYQMADYHVDEFPHRLEEFQKRIHPEDADYVLHEAQKHIEGKTDRFIVEFRFKKKNGDWLWVRGRGLIVERDKNKAPLRFIGTHTDITDRKQVEIKLKESEAFLTQVFDSSHMPIVVMEADTFHYIDCNSAAIEIYGYKSKKQVLGLTPIDVSAPYQYDGNASSEKALYYINKAKTEGSVIFEWKHQRPDGKVWDAEVHLLSFSVGNRALIQFTLVDITKQKQAKKLLRNSEETFRGIFNNTTDAIYVQDENGVFLDVNQGAVIMYGYSKEELIGNTPELVSAPGMNDLKKVNDYIQKARNGEPQQFEFWGMRKNGEIFPKIVRVSAGNYFGKKITLAFATDITKRKHVEEKLKESETRFRRLAETTSAAILIYHNDYFIYANPAAEIITGYRLDELKQMKFWSIVSPEYQNLIKERGQLRQRGKFAPSGYAFKIITKQGKEKWIFLTGNTIELEGRKAGLITAIDITKRKQTEEELIKLSTAVTQSPSIITITDTQGNLEYVNPKFTEITGYTLEEVVGQNPRMLQSGEHPHMFYKEMWKTISSGKTWQGEMHNKKKNGELFWTLSSISPIFDEKSKIINYVDVAEDITKQKRNQLIQNIIHNISNAVITNYNLVNFLTLVRDELGKIIDTTNFFIALYDEETDSISLPLHHDKNDKFKTFPSGKTLTNHVIKTGKTILARKSTIEKLIKSGEVEPVGHLSKVWLGVPLKIKNKVIGVAAVQSYDNKNAFDEADVRILEIISDQISLSIERLKVEEDLKLAKEKAEESEYKVRSMFENTQIGILYCNAEGKILEANQVLLKILGSPSMEATSKINLLTFKPLQENGFAQNLKKCISEKTIVTEDTVYTSKWGKTVFMKYYLVPVILNNKVIGVWANLNNLTDLWNIQNQLKKAKEKAEESDRLKSAFLANMSHEIRTPMNGILGFTKLLKEPQLTGDEKEKYIQVIEKSGKRMLNTINDIIDISKIEAGQVKVVNSEISINKLLVEQYKFFNNEAKSKGLELIYKPSLSEKESHIITDKHKLEGILTNLLKNAVKYTKTGTITFGYHLKDNVNGRFIEFYVKDTGIGIPENRVEAIFNRFEQADIADTKVFEGSGLGLAISKSYVKMLGGEIGVNSKEGSGSTFTFSIPFQIQNIKENVATQNTEKDTKVSLKNLSVIIAEDDETSKIFLETILENHVKQITFSTTGKETIKKFQENPNTDIILMDIKMPDMNGYEATREIRKFNSNVVIIAQTAYGLASDKDIALEAGCDDYIAKPIDEKILLEKMSAWADKKHI